MRLRRLTATEELLLPEEAKALLPLLFAYPSLTPEDALALALNLVLLAHAGDFATPPEPIQLLSRFSLSALADSCEEYHRRVAAGEDFGFVPKEDEDDFLQG